MQRLMIVLTLCLLLVTVLDDFRSVRPQGTGAVYIRADGSIDPPTAPIQRNGNLYALTDDITTGSDGIVLEMNNITFDGSGHTIRGPYANAPEELQIPPCNGIALSYVNNIVVMNVTVEDFTDGCVVGSCSNVTVTKNVFANNWIGLSLQVGSLIMAVANNMTDNNYPATCDGAGKIFHNNFINNTNGIWGDSAGPYPSMGGNFWSGYTGVDADGDGIGDTPYMGDRYPLMSPCSEWINTVVSISTSAPTTSLGFAVKIDGTLTDAYGKPLQHKTVILSYIVTGMSEWAVITSSTTDSEGYYSAQWMPQATGYFMIKAEWHGNATHYCTSNNVALATLPYESSYVFSVESNSTITALGFNSTSSELSFNASGPSGTTGYTKITLAKSLIGNVADIKVYVDQSQISYTSKSVDDSWELSFTYAHSTHEIRIGLGTAPASFAETPLGRALICGIVISVIAVIAAALLFLRKRKQRRSKS